MPRTAPVVGFLHTSPVHPPAFDALAAMLLPGVRILHTVDPSLLADARRLGPAGVADRVRDAVTELREGGADAVCCTCSSIGAVAEQAETSAGVPVLRVDRPMARAAVARGGRVVVIAALTSTLEPTRALLAEEASHAGTAPAIELRTVDGAWERFEAGDLPAYLERLDRAVQEVIDDGAADAVVLAQASMAPLADRWADARTPVLAAPREAVLALRETLLSGRQ